MTNEEAIDILRNAAWLGTDADREQIENAVEMAINALTAQPETHDKHTETHACDLISRQAVIDAIKGEIEINGYSHVVDVLKQLPSVQPEIVRCKDCIKQPLCKFSQYQGNDGYCSLAERKTDE